MVKKELLDKIKNFHGFNSNMLYNELILLDNPTKFDEDNYRKFFIIMATALNEELTLDQIQDLLQKFHLLNPEIINRIINKINSLYQNGWIGFSGKSQSTKETVKIYLSVDNSYLHFFIIEYLKTCLVKEISDYDFKINNDERESRRDNIVFYCTKENFGKHIQVLEEVIKNNPQVKFNSPHLLGMPYDDNIYCGMDFDDGDTSFTDKLCQSIFSAFRSGKSPEEIVSIVEMYKLKQSTSLHKLAEQTKAKKY